MLLCTLISPKWWGVINFFLKGRNIEIFGGLVCFWNLLYYGVASHRSITRTSRVIFSSPLVPSLFRLVHYRPVAALLLRLSLSSDFYYSLSSRFPIRGISEAVKRHNAAISLGATSKFAEVRMTVVELLHWRAVKWSFPDYYCRGFHFSTVKKLPRILPRLGYSRPIPTRDTSRLMCAILYKIMYDPPGDSEFSSLSLLKHSPGKTKRTETFSPSCYWNYVD